MSGLGVERQLLEGALCCHPSLQHTMYIRQLGGGQVPLPATLLGKHEASQQWHKCGSAQLFSSSLGVRSMQGSLQNCPLLRAVSWKSNHIFLIKRTERMQSLHLAATSSFSEDHIWGGRGKTTANKQKREWGGWAQIRLISLRLFCMFIFNLGLATSKFT